MYVALHSLQQDNVNIGVLQETKLPRGNHTRYGAGYAIWATQEESRYCGGVVVAGREKEEWQVEVIAMYILNVVSFMLKTGRWIWYVIGEYMTANNSPTGYTLIRRYVNQQREYSSYF